MKSHLIPKLRILPALAIAITALLVLDACSSASSSKQADAVNIVRVWPDYHAADYFDRISEYFTDKENSGGQVILRTHPEHRAGFYLFMRMKIPADIAGARVEVGVITPQSAERKIFTLAAPVLAKGVVLLNPGLTGADWPDPKMQPVAWRVRLLAADGSQIAAEQSYLWAK